LEIAQIIGAVTFDGNVLNARFIFVLFLAALAQVMHAHGLYLIWPSISYICNSMVVYTLILLLGVRLTSKFVRKDDDCIKALLTTVITFFEQEEQTPDHLSVLLANLEFLKSLLKYYLTFSFALYCIPNPTAWIVSWYTGELTLFTPFSLPFTDPKIFSDYIINSAILAFYTMLVYVCFMTSDVLYIFFVYQCIVMIEINCKKWQEFGEKLIEAKTDKKKTVTRLSEPSISLRQLIQLKTQQQSEEKKLKKIANLERKLIALIKDFNTYNDYVQAIVEFLAFTTFLTMTLNSLAIAMSIVVMLFFSKAVGVVMMMILLFQVLMSCHLGTLIFHQKEKLLDELLNFPWYELSNSKQKLFLQFIHLVQNSNEFRLPIVGKIDMKLFTGVMNGTYSYFKYLRNFVKSIN
jgi:hypothetical protein